MDLGPVQNQIGVHIAEETEEFVLTKVFLQFNKHVLNAQVVEKKFQIHVQIAVGEENQKSIGAKLLCPTILALISLSSFFLWEDYVLDVGSELVDSTIRVMGYIVASLAWLSLAWFVVRILDVFFWESLVAPRLGGQVPGELTGLLNIGHAVLVAHAGEADDRRGVIEGVEETVRRQVQHPIAAARRNPADRPGRYQSVERVVGQAMAFRRSIEVGVCSHRLMLLGAGFKLQASSRKQAVAN